MDDKTEETTKQLIRDIIEGKYDARWCWFRINNSVSIKTKNKTQKRGMVKYE